MTVPILVLLGLSVLDLGLMYEYETDVRHRQTRIRRASSPNTPTIRVGHNKRRRT